MNLMMALTIGFLVAIGVLQFLQRDAMRVVAGLALFWSAANLLIIAVGKTPGVRAPITHIGSGPMADPLVQALVLTAIVISLGFIAFLVTIGYWLAQRGGSIDVNDFTEGRG